MPSLPIRIAILECDTPLTNTRAEYGGYGGVFKSLLTAGTAVLNPPLAPSDLSFSIFDVVTGQEYPKLDDIDAVLITGSKHNSFDNDLWILKLVEFCKGVLEQRRVRLIGVCFGHQILGRALGSEVGRSEKGWEISVTPIELTAKGQEIFGKDTIAIHQMHRDVVFSYPPGVENLAYTSKCTVQAMYIPKRLITVQGHPEFTGKIVREILVARHGAGVFDDEMLGEAVGRVDSSHDGVVIAGAFLRFLLE